VEWEENQAMVIHVKTNLVRDNGNFVVGSCWGAKRQSGKYLANELSKMDSRITFYLNQDFSNPRHGNNITKTIDIWKGNYGISNIYLKDGWIKSKAGNIQLIKSQNKTGDILIDPRKGHEVIQELFEIGK
jgi:hypothetical protein